MKYTIFCGGINGDCTARIKELNLNIFVKQINK